MGRKVLFWLEVLLFFSLFKIFILFFVLCWLTVLGGSAYGCLAPCTWQNLMVAGVCGAGASL
jgi:hypothetical protein